MHLKIIAVGKLKEKYLTQGVKEYLKRLTPFARVEIIEVGEERLPDRSRPLEEAAAREREGQAIRRQIKPGSFTIALVIEGKQLTSEQFAEMFADLALRGQNEINFIIGGSTGLADSIINQADFKLSFSKMTFPHQLMRLVLLEQIYRAFKINRGEPYHK
ncbi:MAG TPA: 23S rRNA (pseudouridine(1915)-N(3))-methyltransferase RlmH [Clostridia bacterium]|nr:23S rRNA (pseudouridine(1915)-N(3))-methyltransferase RlmH [Clostridia bacterium]